MRSVVFATLFLTACASAPPVEPSRPPPPTVDIPVARSCLPEKRPARPTTYTARELVKLDDYKLVLALRRDSILLAVYASELEAILKACE